MAKEVEEERDEVAKQIEEKGEEGIDVAKEIEKVKHWLKNVLDNTHYRSRGIIVEKAKTFKIDFLET